MIGNDGFTMDADVASSLLRITLPQQDIIFPLLTAALARQLLGLMSPLLAAVGSKAYPEYAMEQLNLEYE